MSMSVEDAKAWNPDADWVEMRHPTVEGTAVVTREAFDEVWAEKGWVLVTSDAAPSALAPAPADSTPDKPKPVRADKEQ
jgi:hypothetical protein